MNVYEQSPASGGQGIDFPPKQNSSDSPSLRRRRRVMRQETTGLEECHYSSILFYKTENSMRILTGTLDCL